jgi:sugar (pentulose or hexulose) kinase
VKSARYILLDIGGTDIKTAVTDVDRLSLINLRRAEVPKFLRLKDEFKEIDPAALLSIVEGEITWQRQHSHEIVGILVSSQMACWILTDRNGQNLTHLISWQDRRSTLLVQATLPSDLLEINGGETSAGLPALGLLHFMSDKTNMIDDPSFQTLCSWIIRNLCGGKNLASCHATDAAATGLVDIQNFQWRADLLGNGLDGIEYPEIKQDLARVGSLKNSSIPVFIGVGDQQASLLGAGIDDTTLIVNIGTGGQVACLGRKTDKQSQERPFFNSSYITTRTHLPAGRLFSRILEVLRTSYDYPITYKEMAVWNIASERRIQVDELTVENCEQMISTFKALGYEIEEIISIFLGSVAEVYAKEVKKLQRNHHTKVIFAGGVGQRFVNLQRVIGDYTNLEVEASNAEETTLMGLATLSRQI